LPACAAPQPCPTSRLNREERPEPIRIGVDDFLEGVEAFGQHIPPLMKSRSTISAPAVA